LAADGKSRFDRQEGKMMMRQRHLLRWFAVVAFALALAGCSDDDNPTGSGNGGNGDGPPEFTVSQVSVPEAMRQSNDPFAILTVSYVNLANSFSNWFGYFTPPASAKIARPAATQDGPPWAYNYTQGGLTVTLTIDVEGDNYTWDVVADGTDGSTTYDNFHWLHGERSMDEKSGSIVAYDPDVTGPVAEWDWSFSPTDVYSFLMTAYDEFENIQIDLTVNPDASGQLESRSGSGNEYLPEFTSQWQSSGAGMWQQYSEGEVVDSGSWE
jgi:hypothetical protein